MAAEKMKSHHDHASQYTALIFDELRRIRESWENIAEYSRKLGQVSEDAERRLMLPRE